ncbi:MAG: hypothetical protein LQ347_004118 [Umbilicaria vellea]|nr:MAG: hypothetical protein LQ347_004118 [Umbilicaria vellea]
MPTSSTAIPSSSPPQLPVPSIELDGNGEATLMGRSSNSSHYQLSANSLVSRIHLRALYVPGVPPAQAKIRIECLGWNGVKVHCCGKVFEVAKGESFSSEKDNVDLMLDVHDARVLVKWPSPEKRKSVSPESDSVWDDENSPSRTIAAVQYRSPNTSPLRQRHRMLSPISPSPVVLAPSSPPFMASDTADHIQVYEDEQADELPFPALDSAGATQSTHIASQVFGATMDASQSSSLSEPQDFSDQDEENDPIIQSFGPFGDNLLPRLASFTAGDTPERPESVGSESASTEDDETNPVVNHAINQLAYSRLSSTPLSTILSNLPVELKTDSPGSKENRKLSVKDLRRMLDATRCIGEVTREGKDAAGKPLESEYYYIPDADSDEKRRDAVVEGLKKPGLRACRKQHKQYYWRKPKN